MKLASAAAANELVFEVDVPSQGLILVGDIPSECKVKVDLITSNANDVNRIPEVYIEDLLDINTYIGADSVRTWDDNNAVHQNYPLILFSAGGVLLFDDDTKYKVTFTELGGATFDVHNLDNSKLGVPMVVKKAEVKQTQAERTENYGNVDFLLFNGDHSPTKLTHLVNDNVGVNGAPKVRKVEIDEEQIKAYHASFEASQRATVGGLFSNGVGSYGFPIDQLDALTLHHDTSLNEDMSYLTVDYS
ncbi:hypothetical protein [Flagellimonas sp. 2504JD4-2]